MHSPREISIPTPGEITHTPRGHFLKTRFLYKKIHAQQLPTKPAYIGRENVGRRG